MLLEGLHIPVSTPFRRDGRLDLPALAADVARYSLTPAAGLIVLGPPAEATLLTDNETREALHAAAQAASPGKVLAAGIHRDSARAVLELAAFAAEHRYDAVLVPAPSVLVAAQVLELLTFFRAIADRSPLPLVLLSTPARCISAGSAATLAAHPNILGLLSTHPVPAREILELTAAIRRDVNVTQTFAAVTGRMRSSAESSLIAPASLTAGVAGQPTSAVPPLRMRTRSVGFQIVAADAPTLLDALQTGAAGIAPALAAASPQACYEVFAAWKDQDHALAAEKQLRLVEPARLVDSLGPGGLKFASDLNGYAGGFPRLPHLPPTGEQRAALQQLMKPLHN